MICLLKSVNCGLFAPNKRFEEMVSRYAKNGIIVLSMTDLGFLQLARKFIFILDSKDSTLTIICLCVATRSLKNIWYLRIFML